MYYLTMILTIVINRAWFLNEKSSVFIPLVDVSYSSKILDFRLNLRKTFRRSWRYSYDCEIIPPVFSKIIGMNLRLLAVAIASYLFRFSCRRLFSVELRNYRFLPGVWRVSIDWEWMNPGGVDDYVLVFIIIILFSKILLRDIPI